MTSTGFTANEVRAMASDLRNASATSMFGTHISVPVAQAAAMVAALSAYAADLERRAEGVTEAVRVAGAMLANCALNLAQCDRLTTRERQSLNASRKVWDAAIATMPVAAEPAQPADSGRVVHAKAMTHLPSDAWIDGLASVLRECDECPAAAQIEELKPIFAALAAQGQSPASPAGVPDEMVVPYGSASGKHDYTYGYEKGTADGWNKCRLATLSAGTSAQESQSNG